MRIDSGGEVRGTALAAWHADPPLPPGDRLAAGPARSNPQRLPAPLSSPLLSEVSGGYRTRTLFRLIPHSLI